MGGITGLTNVAALTNVRSYSDKSAQAADSTQVIAQGSRLTKASVDASSLALSEKLRSNIDVLGVANSNAAQGASVVQVAVGAQQNILNLLTSMKSLTTKANNGSNDSKALALIDAEFQKLLSQVDNIADQARWNGKSLLNGGVGSATVAGAAAAAFGNAGTATANTFAANAVTIGTSTGYLTGVFTDVDVNAVGAGYEVSVTMKDSTPGGEMTQVFKGTTFAPVAGESFRVQSTTDSQNTLTIAFDGADVSGITNEATFESGLKAALNIGAGLVGSTISSLATAVNNGLTGVAAASNTPAGTYALTFDSNSNILKLTTGQEKYEVTMTAGGAQTVTFDNGVVATLDGTFALNTAVTQVVFDVNPNASAISMNFQVAEKASDTLTVQVAGSTISALGLTNANVKSQADAVSAGNLLDAALQTINNSVAQLGAQQKQLESASSNLRTTIENNVAARAVYNDADVPAEMAKLTQATVFSKLSQAMITQSLDLQKDLVALAR